MTRARIGRIGILLLIVAALTAFLTFGGTDRLSISGLKEDRDALLQVVADWPVASAIVFALAYVAVTAFSLPGAAAMTLAAGALFGLILGAFIVSFASTVGATLAMLSARFVARDWVRARFPSAVKAVDRGLERDGNFYLLSLRLIPAFPFFLVNLAMGLTAIGLRPFALFSMVGMLPATLVFVNAGTQLAAIDSTRDILSPALLASLVMLGLLPLIAKGTLGLIRRRRVYKNYRRPKHFDRNLIVIGAGAGGLVTAYIAAAVRAKVTLVEAGKMGGDCLNYGCVPSKALIRCARLAHEMRNADRFGLTASEPAVDLKAVMSRVRDVIAEIAPADSVERYTALGADVRLGHATIIDPWTVEILDREGGVQRLTTRSIVIAAGAEPAIPDIPGLATSGFLTSDTMWEALERRDAAPRRLMIIGGGPIGIEMAQAFARLGSKVIQIVAGPRILPKEDEEVSTFIAEILRREGVDIRIGHKAVRCEGKSLIVEHGGQESAIAFDDIIVAVGRQARLKGYGLEELGIETDGTVVVDEALKTLYPNIFAVGDVAGPYQFTHVAAHQAWYAAVNALFGWVRTFRVDYTVIPWTTFTDPEVAHVGHSAASADAAGVAYEVVRYDLHKLDRAVAEGANHGFVKVLVPPGKDRILGVTIVAAQAGELLAEFVLAMKHGLGLNKILGTIHAYPTMAEANKYAAGEWKKANQPERLLSWVEHYHRWRRK